MARKSYKNLDLNLIKAKMVKFKAYTAGIVYNGLVHEVPRRKIVNNLKNQARNTAQLCGFSAEECNELYQTAYRMYLESLRQSQLGLNKARKARKGISYRKYLKSRSNVVYEHLNHILFSKGQLDKEINSIIAQKEKNFRTNQIKTLLEQPDTINYTPFFLCSSHIKPAKDHAEWQGKMYYDQNFLDRIENTQLANKVSAYIRNHKLISIQEIMGPPVYLITRRNCKHYFVPIPIERVLGSSVNVLLKNYHMIRQEEEMITDARRAKNAYKARYKTHLEMWKVMPNEELAQDMAKDKTLIKKWTLLEEK